MENEMSETMIVAAAMVWKGVVCSLPAPARHSDIIEAIAQNIPENEWPVSGEDGFLTSSGKFVGRNDGMEIARAAGQTDSSSDTLYSEDLW
jgi:hypothetical protein